MHGIEAGIWAVAYRNSVLYRLKTCMLYSLNAMSYGHTTISLSDHWHLWSPGGAEWMAVVRLTAFLFE
jgi:hypothetical protein